MQFKIYTVAISTLKTYYNSIFHSVRLLYTLSRRIHVDLLDIMGKKEEVSAYTVWKYQWSRCRKMY